MARASASSTILPLYFPLFSLQQRRNNKIITSSAHFSNTHLHKLTIANKNLRLSRIKPDGFVVYCLANDRIEEKNSSNEEFAQIESCAWNWRGYSIRYQCSGSNGPAMVLIHGFGANRSRSLIFRFSLAGN